MVVVLVCDLLTCFFVRLLLTRELATTQTYVMNVIRQVLKAAQEHLELDRKEKAKGEYLLHACISNKTRVSAIPHRFT